jgi:alkylation response protein AidB-like acyl-CoA dehydrogenase
LDNYSGVLYHSLSEMNFNVSKRQKKFLKIIDNTSKSIREHEEQCYLDERANDRLVPVFKKIGMLGCPISTKYGGLGYDVLTYCLALERIGEEGNSIRTFLSAHTSIGQLILQGWADEAQKRKYLPPTTKGQSIMAFALTEPNAGSDPSSMEMVFEEKNYHYVLNGKKHWVGNGTFASLLTTYAKERNSKDGHGDGKISAFIVDRDCPGITRREIKNKLGLLTVTNAELIFDNCIIPKGNLLGVKGQGLSVAYSALIDGRLSVAAGAIGVIKDCLNESISYSKNRVQHGAALGKKQLIQQHIAQMLVSLETSRWLVYRAAVARQLLHDYVEKYKKETMDWQAKLNKSNKKYTQIRNEADRISAISKFYVSNASFDAANRSVQIFGSAAYTKRSRVARHFLDSRATMIYEGANEVLTLKIGSQILGEDYRAY